MTEPTKKRRDPKPPKQQQPVHLMKGWGHSKLEGLMPQVWCPEGDPDQFVTEPLFATCKGCLEARSRAASAVGVKS